MPHPDLLQWRRHCKASDRKRGKSFIKDRQARGRRGLSTHTGEFTSSESPDITSAQSCFLLKALSSRWASPRVVTYWKPHKWAGTNAEKRENIYIYIKEDNLFAFASRGHQQTAACFPPAAPTADVTNLIISLIRLDDKTECRIRSLGLIS